MPTVTRDGVSIHYEHDRGEGDAVVFLQGVGAGRWQWRWQREVLGGYDLFAPDTRGTGRSDAGLPPVLPSLPRRLRSRLLTGRFSYDGDTLAADLEAVLEDAGIHNAHLVGVDLGGLVAQRYALEYRRAASLTLVGTTPGGEDSVAMDDDVRDRLLATPGSKREALRERTRPFFTERFTNRNPHLMDRLVEWRLVHDPDDPALEAQLGALERIDVSDRLERIRVPTLVIHGTDDRIVPVENGRLLADRVPGSEYLELEGGSHGCFIEEDERVTDRIRTFLAQVAETPHTA